MKNMKKMYIHTLCAVLVSVLAYFVVHGSEDFMGMRLYLLGMVVTAWVLYILVAKKN